ncbi:MAG: glycosyltransferase family 4 protein [bacterium]|nr:glycosyltransferase family 4 protein [bacterium]
MRICQLSTRRDFYGGEVCLANLARGLRQRGHQTTCVVRPDARLAPELAARGLPVHVLPLRDWYEPVSIARLAAWLRRERVAILHAHNPRDWFIAAAATVGTGTVCVGSRHLLRPVAHVALKRSFLQRLGAMIAVSDAVRVSAAGLVVPERLVTVPNGIELETEEQAGPALRRELGLAPRQPVVGCVARLSPEKGLGDLLQAVSLLRGRWPQLALILVGEAPAGSGHADDLRRRAAGLGLEDRVHFCGYRRSAADLCAAFDVHVTSSLAEPCGLATLEAMARGRPVVATASGGSPELVDDGVEGFLVPPGDPVRLAARLDCLLDSEGLRREMGRRGRARVERDFGLDLMAERTEAVYLEALARVPG